MCMLRRFFLCYALCALVTSTYWFRHVSMFFFSPFCVVANMTIIVVEFIKIFHTLSIYIRNGNSFLIIKFVK